jgi:hypothetical protein
MDFREGNLVKRVLASLMCLAMLSMTVMGVAAAAQTQVVMSGDVATQPENTPPTRNWVLYIRNVSTGVFRIGPATPRLGIGSFELNTPTGADKATLFNYDHVGTALSTVDALAYETYRSTGNDQQVAALNIEVDVNGAAPGGFTTLVFEPVYNTSQGAVVSDVWQSWNAFDGGNAVWWSSNPIPAAPNRDTFVSWNTIVAANPGAAIVGGFGVNQGSGNPALTTAVDALTFGASGDSVTYDFEPSLQPNTKDDCKNGGWQTFYNPAFANQGECVSWVNHNR